MEKSALRKIIEYLQSGRIRNAKLDTLVEKGYIKPKEAYLEGALTANSNISNKHEVTIRTSEDGFEKNEFTRYQALNTTPPQVVVNPNASQRNIPSLEDSLFIRHELEEIKEMGKLPSEMALNVEQLLSEASPEAKEYLKRLTTVP